MPDLSLSSIAEEAARVGLDLRGAFHPAPADGVPGETGTLVLLGWAGRGGWDVFAASPEMADGVAHPLDRWSRRVVDGLAERFGAEALYPFGGPPWHPFQRWAQRAEPLSPSPLGLFIHPEVGLWHSWRGALAVRRRLDLPPRAEAASPCAGCAEKPCLTACPVGAFTPGGYDVAACAAHLRAPAGRPCREGGCLARRACPVASHLAYAPDQARFYMRAFLAAR